MSHHRTSRRRAIALAVATAASAVVLVGGPAAQPASAASYGPQTTVAFSGLSTPYGVAVSGSAGSTVYATTYGNLDTIPSVQSKGSGSQAQVGSTEFASPFGLARDAAGNLYVSDISTNAVYRIPAAGGEATELTIDGLSSPTGLAVDTAGNVYVADSANGRVVKEPADGGAQSDVAFTDLTEPYAVAVDGTGTVYATDLAENAVVKLPSGGSQSTLGFTGLSSPDGIAVAAGLVYVSDADNDRVVTLPVAGGTQATLGFTGLSAPAGIAVSPNGSVFVADSGNDRVVSLPVPVTASQSVYVALSPCRVVDTRVTGGPFAANEQRSFQIGGTGAGFAAQGGKAGGCGVPDGATAVAASVTAVTPSGPGYFRAWPSDESAPTATFLNFAKGQSITNTGAISLAETGTKDLTARNYVSGSHYVIDVQGYYIDPEAAPTGSVYVALSPCRVVDTRVKGGAFTVNQQRSFQVGGTGAGFAAQGGKAGGCGVPDGATAVAASITAVTPAANGFLRAWPSNESAPTATFLNFAKGQSITNTGAISLAPNGTQDLTLKNYSQGSHFVIDVQGYFVPQGTVTGGAYYVAVSPCRVVDTRVAGGAFTVNQQRSFQVGGTGAGFAAQGGKAGGCGVPDGAKAFEGTVTAVSPGANGFLRAWPSNESAPTATFLNFVKGQSITNTGAISLAPSGTQDLTLKNYSQGSHFVVDVQGYYVS
jgi:sugar lactone lactonase YvrE